MFIMKENYDLPFGIGDSHCYHGSMVVLLATPALSVSSISVSLPGVFMRQILVQSPGWH